MSLIKGNHAGLGGSGAPGGALGSFYGHTIDQSLRFNDGDSAYLSWTPPGAGEDQVWTISLWVKRCNLSSNQGIFSAGANTSNIVQINWQANDSIRVWTEVSGTVRCRGETNAVFRDTSAWYHIVWRYDATVPVTNLYVNGVEQSVTYDTSIASASTVMFSTTNHDLGRRSDNNVYLDSYVAEFHGIDGTALYPASFGETKDGVWIPKKYSGSYGNEGFYLTFQGTGTATTSQDTTAQTNIGDDQSGNGKNWAVNNLAAHDVVPDSPTNNFATLNPLAEDDVNIKSGAVLSEGNLVTATAGFGSGSPWGGGQSTLAIPTDKKIYCEVLCSNQEGNYWAAGVSIPELSANNTGSSNTGQINAYNRAAMINGVETDYGSSAGLGGLGVSKLAVDDILQIAVDGATGKVWFGRNGTYFKSPSTNNSGTTGDPAAGSNEIGTVTNTDGKPLFIVIMGGSATCHINFGADSSFAGRKTAQGNADGEGFGDFYYTPPTGYLALCSSNMSDITIGPGQTSQADDHFNTVLYTGNGTDDTGITGVGFQPDWVWIKGRNTTYQPSLYDSVRGTNPNGGRLATDGTYAENIASTNLKSFDSDGFTLSTKINSNENNKTYVAWNWKAGGSASSNSDGSNITSSVSANTDAGFSIVAYTGTGTGSHTVGHGLTQKPDLVIVKNRDGDSAPNYWHVNHKDLTAADNNIFLNLNSAATDVNTNYAEGGIGLGDANVIDFVAGYSGANNVANCNKSGSDYIAYCFHEVEGYSKFGKFSGNGADDGPFVYTGFRPAWVMTKRSDSSAEWHIMDDKRNPFNLMDGLLFADGTYAETSDAAYGRDFLSNGFKIRGSEAYVNASGGTFIYLAFAHSPFKFGTAF